MSPVDQSEVCAARPPFHLAFTVSDLVRTPDFYESLLGCSPGRRSPSWIDFDFFGHQITLHLGHTHPPPSHNEVDAHRVPVPHFGVVLPWGQWHDLVDRLKGFGVRFTIDPYIRFRGKIGEQATFFIVDPSGNNLEFKSFKNPETLFQTEASTPA